MTTLLRRSGRITMSFNDFHANEPVIKMKILLLRKNNMHRQALKLYRWYFDIIIIKMS